MFQLKTTDYKKANTKSGMNLIHI